MRTVLTAALVLLAAAPAVAREMVTTEETAVRAQPKKKAEVLATLAENVRITSDDRKDNWFRVTVEVGGKEVTGWVHRGTVNDLLGRSKGQLLGENKRLYAEVVELRKTVKLLRADVEALRTERDKLRAELNDARGEIKRLKAPPEKGTAEPAKTEAAPKGS